MPKINFQFHAEPAELLYLLVGWCDGIPLYVAVERFRASGYQVTGVPVGSVSGALLAIRDADRVALSLSPISLAAESSIEFLRMNLAACSCMSVDFHLMA